MVGISILKIKTNCYELNDPKFGGGKGIRTPVRAFAERCLTTRPYHQTLIEGPSEALAPRICQFNIPSLSFSKG